ncbi:MAG: hypothetical protein K2I53_01635 [Lachnospiraceae bacterium]|nr:hypothetical protein [Lachnospiraceae bacterium]
MIVYLEGKVKITVCGTVVLIGDEKLAAALLEMQKKNNGGKLPTEGVITHL